MRTAPADERLLFCQGDFLPGQILCHPTGWSVIDFDDSRYADPLSDVAAMYAALPRELGLPAEQAERADVDPKVFTKIHFHFIVSGRNLKPAAVERAVTLSHEKYCSASIMLAQMAEITHSVEIVEV